MRSDGRATRIRRPDAGERFAARAGAVVAAVLGLCAGLPASADAPVLLLDRSLAERPARLVGLDASSLVVADEAGRAIRLDASNLLAIIAADRRPEASPMPVPTLTEQEVAEIEAAARELGRVPEGLQEAMDATRAAEDTAVSPSVSVDRETWMLTLTDGQRLLGRLEPDEMGGAGGETLRFRSSRLGELEVALERVASVERASVVGVTPDASADVVRLANGDELRGFVVDMGGEIAIERTDGSIAAFDLDLVDSVTLANPAERSGRPLLSLMTGEVIAGVPAAGTETAPRCVLLVADLLRSGPIEDAASGPSRPGSSSSEGLIAHLCVDASEIRSLTLPGEAIHALASIEPSRVVPGDARRRTDPPRVEPASDARLAPSIVFSGPMAVEWTLPDGAGAIAFDARLGPTLSAQTAPPGPWADAMLRISVRGRSGESTLVVQRLDSGSPTVRVAEGLPGVGEGGRTLVIELDAGAHGPIQDRLLLARPVLIMPE